LRSFKNEAWRIKCEPIRDTQTNKRRRKFKKELQQELCLAPVTSFINGQRKQWFCDVMRRGKGKLPEQLWNRN